METYRLKVEDMSKSFPGVKALDNIQLAVKPGTVHALIGENGAGKSTTIKLLLGMTHADAGSITVLDRDEYAPSPLPEGVCSVTDAIGRPITEAKPGQKVDLRTVRLSHQKRSYSL